MKKSYYIIIHFGIPKPIYVTGFVIPTATDEADALEQLKTSLNEHNEKFMTADDTSMHELSAYNIKEYMWSLDRAGEKNERDAELVQIIEINKPIISGYWLQEIGKGSQLCNTRNTF